MRQDTIHHVATPEVPAVQTAEESQANQHVGDYSSDDSIQGEYQEHLPFEEAFNPGISLWQQDSIAILQVDSTATDSLPSLKSTFFSNSMFTEEQQAGRYGMSGDPVPYSIRTDSILTSVIIIATLIMLFCIGRAKNFLSFNTSNFFRTMSADSSLAREAASDTRNLIFITFYGIMVFSLVFYFYTKVYVSDTFITNSEYTLMGIYLGEITAYILLEMMLQNCVNKVFFTKKECDQWIITKLFIYSSAGILLLPLMLLMSYFGLQPENSVIYASIVFVFVKILSFYKVFSIFFKKIGSFLQYFLYLCTLEIIPALMILGILMLTANYLKVNY